MQPKTPTSSFNRALQKELNAYRSGLAMNDGGQIDKKMPGLRSVVAREFLLPPVLQSHDWVVVDSIRDSYFFRCGRTTVVTTIFHEDTCSGCGSRLTAAEVSDAGFPLDIGPHLDIILARRRQASDEYARQMQQLHEAHDEYARLYWSTTVSNRAKTTPLTEDLLKAAFETISRHE